jgi:chemotaxis protein MotA
MDFGTIIGYGLAWGSMMFGMWHLTHSLGPYWKPTEVVLVGGLAVGAAIASTPMHSVLGAFKSVKKMVMNKPVHIDHLIKEMVEFAETARRDGVLALESVSKTHPDPFVRRGLQLTIDGTDPEVVKSTLQMEVAAMAERHKHGKHFWHTCAKFGPGCGLIACLVAQVAMFQNLDGDAAKIGAALAVALTGTLYGAIIQNVIAGPIADRLTGLSKDELFGREVVMQGILSIQAGNNPRVVEMQLLSFVSAGQQEALATAA